MSRLASDFTQNTYPKTRTRKGVSVHHLGRQAEFDTDAPDFIFEKLAQRLNQLQIHVGGQTTHVVVALDDMRLAGLAAGRLDDIRIDRALRQELDAITGICTVSALTGQLLRLFIEDLDEETSDDLALGLRVRNAFELAKETLSGINPDHAHTEVARKNIHHGIAFAISEQTVINEYAHKLIANRLVE